MMNCASRRPDKDRRRGHSAAAATECLLAAAAPQPAARKPRPTGRCRLVQAAPTGHVVPQFIGREMRRFTAVLFVRQFLEQRFQVGALIVHASLLLGSQTRFEVLAPIALATDAAPETGGP